MMVGTTPVELADNAIGRCQEVSLLIAAGVQVWFTNPHEPSHRTAEERRTQQGQSMGGCASLTRRQMELLRYIHGFHLAMGGISPTVMECARATGASKTTTHERLRQLERAGVISRLARRERAITVLAPPVVPSINGIPLYAVPIALSRVA